MATYRASNYNLGAALGNVNADNGWGGYKWPQGVPESLLANFAYQQVNGNRQLIRGRVRAELVELFQLAAAIADRVRGYQIYSFRNGENWGPWTYENRAISGTNSASNHSRARAWDINAPFNGYANGFANITSDIPPALVSDYEAIGLSWGGRYGDAMHFEYARSPGSVASDVARARQILGGQAIGDAPAKPEPTPIIPEEEDDMPYSPEQITQFVASGVARAIQQNDGGVRDLIADSVLARGIESFDGVKYPLSQFLQSINQATAGALDLDTPVAIEELKGGTVTLARVLELLVSRTGQAEQAAAVTLGK